MSPTMHTIERIYPKDLDPSNADDQASLAIHMQRYEFAAEHLSGEHVLDMACGCGYGTALLAQQHPDKQVTGVDIDPAAIAYAQAHYQLPNLRYVCADAEQFASEQGFDCIVSLETIEHLPRPDLLVANYARLLKAGGLVVASVPITPTLDGNPHHLHDFTKRSFYRLLGQQGLQARQQLEQIQWWQFKGLFSRKPDQQKQHRSEGVGNAVLQYYRKHPLYLLGRLAAMLRYGFSNRYLTCVFRQS
ncbi:class I SAM-dependent methyltransferase [Pseudomonas sp. 5P_3.1_Bac2]|uniref:class I SAM-dependent methyltransferase n=1 Tax=Pseudomonas sp. 5P_3.1_Bac2 TaxID=2971617 RepID=UPI0021C9D48E|nr:class I SAM-dependent methyltransferase [Pseudomonas sp. 5P_3.1_Bac2]MCU1718771.1 class I SAM-dependent methyltransferase [Pseudomonas sp. 5P_3.1_Bac2]